MAVHWDGCDHFGFRSSSKSDFSNQSDLESKHTTKSTNDRQPTNRTDFFFGWDHFTPTEQRGSQDIPHYMYQLGELHFWTVFTSRELEGCRDPNESRKDRFSRNFAPAKVSEHSRLQAHLLISCSNVQVQYVLYCT